MHTYLCLLVVVQQNEEYAVAAAAVPAAAGTDDNLVVASLSLMSRGMSTLGFVVKSIQVWVICDCGCIVYALPYGPMLT